MFVIFGLREKEINVQQNQKYKCPTCGEDGCSFFFSIKYVHIFWIPAFPYGKQIVSYCENCQASLF